MNEVLLAYLDHERLAYQGPDGRPTDEIRHVKTVCRPVRELFGDTPAESFGPLALKCVRQRFIEANWCRKTVNSRVERIRRIFKWAVAEELVPPHVYHALSAVSGLQRGRTPAKDPEPVGPVADAVIDATLPLLNRHVRGLIEFQRLTGCRPSEACQVRRCDLDLSGPVWLYKPVRHKATWRGKSRTIPVGPRAQAVQRRRETGEVAPRTARDPRVPKLREHLLRLRELLAATPDVTLAELRDELRVTIAISTLWAAVRGLGPTFKKSHSGGRAGPAGRGRRPLGLAPAGRPGSRPEPGGVRG